MQKAKFGKSPQGERLKRIQQSPHYRDGKFHNLHHTPELAEGYHMLGVIYSQLFKKAKHRYPKGEVPSIKTGDR